MIFRRPQGPKPREFTGVCVLSAPWMLIFRRPSGPEPREFTGVCVLYILRAGGTLDTYMCPYTYTSPAGTLGRVPGPKAGNPCRPPKKQKIIHLCGVLTISGSVGWLDILGRFAASCGIALRGMPPTPYPTIEEDFAAQPAVGNYFSRYHLKIPSKQSAPPSSISASEASRRQLS